MTKSVNGQSTEKMVDPLDQMADRRVHQAHLLRRPQPPALWTEAARRHHVDNELRGFEETAIRPLREVGGAMQHLHALLRRVRRGQRIAAQQHHHFGAVLGEQALPGRHGCLAPGRC